MLTKLKDYFSTFRPVVMIGGGLVVGTVVALLIYLLLR